MRTRPSLLLALALVPACSDPKGGDAADSSEGGTTAGDPDPVVDWPTLACDPLVPEYCGHPFPSNVFTKADDTTPTLRRVVLADETMPTSYYGVRGDPGPWLRSDGFSPGAAILTFLPRASAAGLPSAADIAASLADDAPTIVLHAETGERVPHFAELDLSATDPDKRTLFIRPAVRLENGARYIVALRGVVDHEGAVIAPSPAFAALRDRTPSDEPSVESRRPLYADIFTRLESAGFARDQLQLAWDFTTASDENLVTPLLHMRDQALSLVGDAPAFTIDDIQTDFDPRVAYRVRGTFEVPLFVDQPGPNAVMNLDGACLPTAIGTHDFEFELLVPTRALEQPVQLLHYGHGLLGTHAEIERDEFLELCQNHGWAIYSTDWIGLASADQAYTGVILQTGEIEDFDGMFARLQQSVVNAIVLDRVMTRAMVDEPMIGPTIDASQQAYYGISLGGIMGALYMSVTPDATRGGLEVMGTPFGVLLGRSAQFDAFFQIAQSTYTDPRDIQFVLGLVQMLWDRVEPNGFLTHLRDNPLPDTPAHEVLMRAAVSDHSVSTVGAHIMARSLGVPLVDAGVRDVFGLETVPSPAPAGSAFIEYDFGLPPEPACALPQRACDDPHGSIRVLPEAAEQLDHFLREGEVVNTCPGGVCKFPQSGCDPTPAADVCAE
ncbi:MAG: hypothetical protein IPN32_26235 [Deltaproteobacteria bacterium]|nr:hypothetical protein [Deltaproteobacteria bacterium]